MTHISFSSLFRKITWGEKTDWVGKKLTSQIFPRGKKLTGQFFPRGKNGPAHSFPGEKTDWGKTDRYTGTGPRDSAFSESSAVEVAGSLAFTGEQDSSLTHFLKTVHRHI